MILVIGGATATGKTALSVRLAHALNGEIVSADSMQIYRGMDIGTAKVTEEEKEGVPHYLVDIVDPNESFSAAMYAERAEACIRDIESRGKLPIMVGGTGLYINAVLYGFRCGAYDENLRAELIAKGEKEGAEKMWQYLASLDALSAEKIHPNNRKRVIRALEVFLLTGQSMSAQDDKSSSVPHLMYAVDIERQTLYRRIDERVEKMFETGLEEEVKRLLRGGADFSMQSMQAIGYREFAPYFAGEINRDELKSLICQHSRNYAKRQMTWFRSQVDCAMLNPQETQHVFEFICEQVRKTEK